MPLNRRKSLRIFSSGRALVGELSDRRAQTATRIGELQTRLASADGLVHGKACVYATGSFGRCDASRHSDLDLFILGKSDGKKGSSLSSLDAICVMADLIRTTRDLSIPEFSGDGRYLVHYSVHDLVDTLGGREDDVTNTFTARLLLLLESRALLEPMVYREVVTTVLDAYWRDYDDHKSDFMPAFLGNDILRLWRTFCVNYEARTERMPAVEKAKGKIKNYKLKHSRLLTCYSGLLYLLAVYGSHHAVSPTDAVTMINLTPTERLEWLIQQAEFAHAHEAIHKLLAQYELFLETTNAKESDLIDRMLDKKTGQAYMTAAYKFGDQVFEALNTIGNGNRFHRLLVV